MDFFCSPKFDRKTDKVIRNEEKIYCLFKTALKVKIYETASALCYIHYLSILA